MLLLLLFSRFEFLSFLKSHCFNSFTHGQFQPWPCYNNHVYIDDLDIHSPGSGLFLGLRLTFILLLKLTFPFGNPCGTWNVNLRYVVISASFPLVPVSVANTFKSQVPQPEAQESFLISLPLISYAFHHQVLSYLLSSLVPICFPALLGPSSHYDPPSMTAVAFQLTLCLHVGLPSTDFFKNVSLIKSLFSSMLN